MTNPIVITGFMGSGKSKVARELSRHLNLTMIDLDDAITAREGKSPAQLIVEDGEARFRSIESSVLRDLLQTGAAAIISLGGGAWIDETNRKVIDELGCISVWIDAPFDVCWSRIEASAEERPLAKNRDQALELYDRRRPIYQLASIQVFSSGDNLQDVISSLASELAEAEN